MYGQRNFLLSLFQLGTSLKRASGALPSRATIGFVHFLEFFVLGWANFLEILFV